MVFPQKALMILVVLTVAYSCPTPQKIQKELSRLTSYSFKVELVKPLRSIKNLCETVIKIGKRRFIFYTDRSGRYLLVGVNGLVNILDLRERKNITALELENLNNFTVKKTH